MRGSSCTLSRFFVMKKKGLRNDFCTGYKKVETGVGDGVRCVEETGIKARRIGGLGGRWSCGDIGNWYGKCRQASPGFMPGRSLALPIFCISINLLCNICRRYAEAAWPWKVLKSMFIGLLNRSEQKIHYHLIASSRSYINGLIFDFFT